MRIDLTFEQGPDRPVMRIDGLVPDPEPGLSWTEAEGMPFAAIYFDGQRQYDVELWISGTLRHAVPPQSPEVDAVYDPLEADRRGDPLPAGDPPVVGSWEDRQTRRRRVEAEMKAHPGQAAYIRWTALRRTVDVHIRNAAELTNLLDRVATDPVVAMELMQNVRPPDVANEINALIDQRLHNYVASAGSLIDHSRNLFRRYEGQHVAGEYESRKGVLAKEPVNGFVRDLRNYALHRSLPWVGHKVSFTGSGADIAAVTSLGTAELLMWDGWGGPAKALLWAAGDDVDIRTTVEQHTRLVQELYEWVFAQFEGLHRADMAGWHDLREEFNWLLTGGKGQAAYRQPTPSPG